MIKCCMNQNVKKKKKINFFIKIFLPKHILNKILTYFDDKIIE